jgi:hypothetical protein
MNEDDEDDGEDDSDDDESPELKKAMAKKAWLEGKLAERKFVVEAQILRAELRDQTEYTNLEYVDDDCVEEVDDGAHWWRVLTQRIEAWRDGVEQAEGSGKRKRSRADHQEEKQSADDDEDEEEMKQPSPLAKRAKFVPNIGTSIDCGVSTLLMRGVIHVTVVTIIFMPPVDFTKRRPWLAWLEIKEIAKICDTQPALINGKKRWRSDFATGFRRRRS